jgi:hypothetical protein
MNDFFLILFGQFNFCYENFKWDNFCGIIEKSKQFGGIGGSYFSTNVFHFFLKINFLKLF